MAELTQLRQILAFNAIPAGGTATLPHNINLKGVQKAPDWLARDNADFEIVVANTNSVQVQVINRSAAVASCNVYLFFDHTMDRVYGPNMSITQLAPAPFIIGGAAASSGAGQQSFRYVATGAEGSGWVITMPAAMPNDTYAVQMLGAGVANILGIDCPDLAPGDRTTTQFLVATSGAVTAGDQFDITVTRR